MNKIEMAENVMKALKIVNDANVEVFGHEAENGVRAIKDSSSARFIVNGETLSLCHDGACYYANGLGRRLCGPFGHTSTFTAMTSEEDLTKILLAWKENKAAMIAAEEAEKKAKEEAERQALENDPLKDFVL